MLSNFKNVYVLDFGKNTATLSHNGAKCSNIKHADVLNLPSTLPPGSLLICEYAHIGRPRQKYSLSQPFSEETLLSFYSNCEKNDIVLRLFPEKSTPRAIAFSGKEKSDENDPISIWMLLKQFSNISLMLPPKSFSVSSELQEYWDWKEETNKILNVARTTKYDLHQDNKDENTKWILKNISNIYNELNEKERDCFNLSLYVNGGIKVKTKSDWQFGMPQLYCILSIMRDFQGNLRQRKSTGDFPSNNHAKKYIIGMTPFHGRGGVTRSNLYWHGMRNWIIKKGKEHSLDFKRKIKSKSEDTIIRRGNFTPDEEKLFLSCRQQYCKAVMKVYSLIKKMLKEENNLVKM